MKISYWKPEAQHDYQRRDIYVHKAHPIKDWTDPTIIERKIPYALGSKSCLTNSSPISVVDKAIFIYAADILQILYKDIKVYFKIKRTV